MSSHTDTTLPKLTFDDFDTTNGLPDGFSDWENYYCALVEFRREELQKAREERDEEIKQDIEWLKQWFEDYAEQVVPVCFKCGDHKVYENDDGISKWLECDNCGVDGEIRTPYEELRYLVEDLSHQSKE